MKAKFNVHWKKNKNQNSQQGEYKKPYPIGSNTDRFYGIAKVHQIDWNDEKY